MGIFSAATDVLQLTKRVVDNGGMASGIDQTADGLRPLTNSRTQLFAGIGSLFVHLCLVSLVVFTYRRLPEGTASEPAAQPAGVALVRHLEGLTEYVHDAAVMGEPAANAEAPTPDQFLPAESELVIDQSIQLPGAGAGAAEQSPAFSPRPGDVVASIGDVHGNVGTARTSVFGLEGEGNRFIYVFDRSGSMDGFDARPLTAAKSELLKSLNDLERTHQFQIVFYNEKPRIFNPGGGSPQMMWGDDASKRLARAFVASITGTGSTDHMAALRKALALNPDVIFFLTDADEPRLTRRELEAVERLNRGCTIHAIEFGLGPQRSRDNFLTELAARNFGQHIYVNIREL